MKGGRNLEKKEISDKPWEALHDILELEDERQLKSFLGSLNPTETALAISRIDPAEQGRLICLLDPSFAADVMEEVEETQAADIIEELSPQQAAAIVDEMQSDCQADLLGELDEADAEAILHEMEPDEAEEVRAILSYPPDSAGGIMVSEYLSYAQEITIAKVLDDLQENRETYAGYHVLYIYVVDKKERLKGVLRMHDLLFSKRSARLDEVMIKKPVTVQADENMEGLRDFFKGNKFFGAPVIDSRKKLIGVVLPKALEKAEQKKTVNQFLNFSGIVGGEEFRSMPLINRSGRRLSWLSINIVLNIIAASVIAYYQDTLAAAITLAVFLPMISDMSGCSGNQAVAVSMRELSLGLVRPGELLRVLGKEMSLGIINGIALGLLLGGIAILWKGNPWLGLVVGGSLMANTVVAVSFGGILPLLLKKMKLDPALVASPVLTTVTDMCGFFFVLGFATMILSRLG